MNKLEEFKLFLESVKDANPAVVTTIDEASDAIFEGLFGDDKIFPTTDEDRKLRRHWVNHLTKFLIRFNVEEDDEKELKINIEPIVDMLGEYDNTEEAFASIMGDVKAAIVRKTKENPSLALGSDEAGLLAFIDTLTEKFS